MISIGLIWGCWKFEIPMHRRIPETDLIGLASDDGGLVFFFFYEVMLDFWHKSGGKSIYIYEFYIIFYS